MKNELQPELTETPQTPQTEAETQAVQDMTQRLNAITATDERAKNWRTGVFIAGCSLVAMAAVLGKVSSSRHASGGFSLAAALGVIGLSVWLSYGLLDVWRRRVSYPADLSRLGGVHAIPTLFLVWKHAFSTEERAEVHAALAALLPQL